MLGLSVVPNLSSSLFRFSCSSSRNVTFTLQKVLSPQLLQPFLVHSFISIHPESLWFQMSTFTIVHPSKNDIPPLIGIHDHPHLHPATSPLNPTRFLRSVIIQILINVANPAPCLGTNSNIPSSVSGVSMDRSSFPPPQALSSVNGTAHFQLYWISACVIVVGERRMFWRFRHTVVLLRRLFICRLVL